MSADDLARWLCDPAAPAPSLDDMASVFGLSFDALEATGAHDAGTLPTRRLLLTLAVLRDAFPNDGAIRCWLRTAGAGADRPLDLLLDGRVAELEALAVRLWNRRRLHPVGDGAPAAGA